MAVAVKSRTKRNPFEKYLTEEDKVHIGLLQYIRLQYPKALVYHGPNEGKRTPFEQYKAKQLGLKKGWPDLVIIYEGRNMALELKTLKGTATEEQIAWLDGLKANGWHTSLAFGFDEAKAAVDAFCRLKLSCPQCGQGIKSYNEMKNHKCL